jgi:glutathione peroxidase
MTFRVVVMVAVVCVVVLAVRLRQTYAADIVKEPTTMPTVAASAGQPASPLDFTVKDIDEKDVSLSDYKGKVVLIVNVASKCGFTPQYTALEKLYMDHKDQGFVIIGFPANNFHSQEPGTDEEIKQFCSSKYSVTFPLMSKISVKGDDKAPLYKFLTEAPTAGDFKGEITWNFNKFLVDRNGNVMARFASPTKPDDPTLVAAVQKALDSKPPATPQ